MVDPTIHVHVHVCVYRRTCISFGGGVLHAHTSARMHMSRPPNQPMKLVNIIVWRVLVLRRQPQRVRMHARTHASLCLCRME